MDPGFNTLDEAVRATFPVQSTRIVAVSEHGDAAVALFDTRPGAEPYLYEVHYYRANSRWSEGSSSNGSGWHGLSPESDLGVETSWGDAPPDADMVRAERDGRVFEAPAALGAYFLVWWEVLDARADVKAFRVKGEWVRAPATWQEMLAQQDAWRRARGS
jgi:hypothetical protein